MNPWILLQGIAIGFSIAAPVGPIAVLCIQRTLLKGRVTGLTSGLGAATADALYGSIAGFGLTFISNELIGLQVWLRLLGGIFLCFLGVRTLLSKPSQGSSRLAVESLAKDYFSTFLLTVTNPLTILSFAAVFTGLSWSAIGDYGYAGFFVIGIFAGSALWWLLLTSIVSVFRSKFDLKKLQLVNVVSGIIIVGFGLYFLLSLLNFLF